MVNSEYQQVIEQEIQRHKLPKEFMSTISDFYKPLAEKIIQNSNKRNSSQFLFLGLQGTQGSGKSTCAAFLKLLFEEAYKKRTLVISIDDFYLTLNERQTLANEVHPLLITRGVPGTHDLGLLQNTLQACNDLTNLPFQAPVFNKAADDRHPPSNWQTINEPVDIIILEGWCVGIPPQSEGALNKAINELELKEDSEKNWRKYVNQQLKGNYAELYAQFDHLITLQAPSFECVYEWRLLQEQKLKHSLMELGKEKNATKVLSPIELKRFISHYERLTRHALEVLPEKSDWVLSLNADHSFSRLIINTNK